MHRHADHRDRSLSAAFYCSLDRRSFVRPFANLCHCLFNLTPGMRNSRQKVRESGRGDCTVPDSDFSTVSEPGPLAEPMNILENKYQNKLQVLILIENKP